MTSADVTDAERLARAVLLFYDTGPWSAEKCEAWAALTGQHDATTRALGDLARRVLAARPPGPPGRTGVMSAASAAYFDDSFPERACDYCGRPYRGPSIYCCLAHAQADA
jgi:hypothetical protein